MARRPRTRGVIWCGRGFYPTYYGFCPSKQAWDRENKKLEGKLGDYPSSPGSTAECRNDRGDYVCVVTLNESKCDKIGLIGALVHESAHVWQATKRQIGGDTPGAECEAYAIQNIFMNLYDAYLSTRPRKCH